MAPTSSCRYRPGSNSVGVAGPSDAFTVSKMKKSASLDPALTLASHSAPPGSCPRSPPATETSSTSPPNCGVNPPGKRSWNEKQFGSAATRARASESGRSSAMGTVGQPADASRTPSAASSASPISRLRPRSPLKTAARVFGFRKKKPPVTVRLA